MTSMCLLIPVSNYRKQTGDRGERRNKYTTVFLEIPAIINIVDNALQSLIIL